MRHLCHPFRAITLYVYSAPILASSLIINSIRGGPRWIDDLAVVYGNAGKDSLLTSASVTVPNETQHIHSEGMMHRDIKPDVSSNCYPCDIPPSDN